MMDAEIQNRPSEPPTAWRTMAATATVCTMVLAAPDARAQEARAWASKDAARHVGCEPSAPGQQTGGPSLRDDPDCCCMKTEGCGQRTAAKNGANGGRSDGD